MVGESGEGKRLSFMGKIKQIANMKRDPIVSTILSENIITMSSTMLPIISQVGYLAYPSVYWGLGAGGFIGLIQLLVY